MGRMTLLGAGTVASGGLDADTTAWVAAVVSAGGTVSAGRQTIVNTFITALKSASLWTTLDRYWLLAGENAGAAKVDIKSLQSLSLVGSPTFSANNGYTSLDNVNYVDSNYIPSSSAVNYTLNSAVFGGQVQTNRVVGGNFNEYGASNGAFTNISSFNGLSGSNDAPVRVNSTGFDAVVSSTAQGSWIASRTGASAGALYLNGSSAVSISVSSTGLPDASFCVGCLNLAGTPITFPNDQISSFFTASGWNSTQAAAFETAQNAMMTSIGINVH